MERHTRGENKREKERKERKKPALNALLECCLFQQLGISHGAAVIPPFQPLSPKIKARVSSDEVLISTLTSDGATRVQSSYRAPFERRRHHTHIHTHRLSAIALSLERQSGGTSSGVIS